MGNVLPEFSHGSKAQPSTIKNLIFQQFFKNSALSKFRAFPHKNVIQTVQIFFDREEKIVGKEENAGYQHIPFLLVFCYFKENFMSTVYNVLYIVVFISSKFSFSNAIFTLRKVDRNINVLYLLHLIPIITGKKKLSGKKVFYNSLSAV